MKIIEPYYFSKVQFVTTVPYHSRQIETSALGDISLQQEAEKRTLSIPPFRVMCIDFKTVTICVDHPHVRVEHIEDLDEALLHEADEIVVAASQECLSERIALEGPATKRNVIRHIRECYRSIYRQASNLGVRSELQSLRTLIVEYVEVEHIAEGVAQIRPVLLKDAFN